MTRKLVAAIALLLAIVMLALCFPAFESCSSAETEKVSATSVLPDVMSAIDRDKISDIETLDKGLREKLRTEMNAYFCRVRSFLFDKGATTTFDTAMIKAFPKIMGLCKGNSSESVLDFAGKPISARAIDTKLELSYRFGETGFCILKFDKDNNLDRVEMGFAYKDPHTQMGRSSPANTDAGDKSTPTSAPQTPEPKDGKRDAEKQHP